MFGGFVGFNNNKGGDWGEKLLNTVASNTIRHLFTRSESVKVTVSCNPSSKLLQGTIDSFKMEGRGLVIRRDFRTEEMSFETDAVSIDFSSVIQGKISLKQPTQAIAKVKLTETDLNQAFHAELVKKRLENLTLPALTEISGGEAVSFADVELQLLSENKVKLLAKANWEEKVIPISFTSTINVVKRRQIKFENIQFEAEDISSDVQEVSQQLMIALGEILNEMIDLDRFNLDGVKLRLNRLETQGKMLLFSGYAQINHFPKSG